MTNHIVKVAKIKPTIDQPRLIVAESGKVFKVSVTPLWPIRIEGKTFVLFDNSEHDYSKGENLKFATQVAMVEQYLITKSNLIANVLQNLEIQVYEASED